MTVREMEEALFRRASRVIFGLIIVLVLSGFMPSEWSFGFGFSIGVFFMATGTWYILNDVLKNCTWKGSGRS